MSDQQLRSYRLTSLEEPADEMLHAIFRNEILTSEDAARRLQDRYLDQQIYFGTPKALELLKKTDVWKIC